MKESNIPFEGHAFHATALAAMDPGYCGAALGLVGQGTSEAVKDTLLRAEVSLYFDRTEEASEALERLRAEAGSNAAVARRARLIEAGIEYSRGAFEATLGHAHAVLAPAQEAGDKMSLMRAAYDLGRASRRLGRYGDSLEYLTLAQENARTLGSDLYLGLVLFNKAQISYDLSDVDLSLKQTVEALALLERAEDLRFTALCRNFYGQLLCDKGQVEEALAFCAQAEETAANLGLMEDTLRAANNRARALLSLGRYDEAIARLTELVEYERGGANGFLEMRALLMLAIANTAARRFAEAAASASEALRMAHLQGTPADVFDGRLYLARAEAWLADQPGPEIARLRDLVEAADLEGTEFQRAEARIYLAQVLVAPAPLEAAALLQEVRTFRTLETWGWLKNELARLERDMEASPIRVDAQGRLIIDPNVAWPPMKVARESVERFLFDRSMAEARGNAAAAGRLIGESRYQMFHLGRVLRGELPRPSRSKNPDPDTASPVKRRRSRER